MCSQYYSLMRPLGICITNNSNEALLPVFHSDKYNLEKFNCETLSSLTFNSLVWRKSFPANSKSSIIAA